VVFETVKFRELRYLNNPHKYSHYNNITTTQGEGIQEEEEEKIEDMLEKIDIKQQIQLLQEQEQINKQREQQQ
jgi:hypothetical protein